MIDWSSLIAEKDGRISLHRLRKLVAILMGIVGALLLVAAVIVEQVWALNFGLDKLALISAVLVAPMTGGQVADAISGKFLAEKIQNGQAQGRRSTDTPANG